MLDGVETLTTAFGTGQRLIFYITDHTPLGTRPKDLFQDAEENRD